jgi:hypothetical protein
MQDATGCTIALCILGLTSLPGRFERRRTELVFQCRLPDLTALFSGLGKMSVFKPFPSGCFLVFFIVVGHFLHKLEDIKAECAVID